MDDRANHEELVTLLASSQSRLLAFILKLTADREIAADVLQATNLVIWRKASSYEPGTNFYAWAFKIARLQVLSHKQKIGRDRAIFTDAFIEELTDSMSVSELEDPGGPRHDALTKCLEKLPADRRDLLWMRYRDGLSVALIAEAVSKNVDATRQALHRVRMVLMRCVELTLAESGGRP